MPGLGESAAAIVTGHSRGLGAAVAAQLLERGIAVLGLARQTNPELAKRFGGAIEQLQIDLADLAALTRWLGEGALRRFLDGRKTALLVNNAGVLQPVGPLETQDVAAVARAVGVNVGAPLMLSSAFAAATVGAEDRRILHISSGAARSAYAGWSVYCATKATLDQHARAVALDGAAGGKVRISSVAPGVIETAMQAEVRASSEDLFPQRRQFVDMQREGRLLNANDTGRRLAEFLVSKEFGREPVYDLRDFPGS